jgi:UDP-GlcNAc3NAcA epimerase
MVSRALRSVLGVQEILLHTGQHYDKNMSAVFFEELELPEPDYCLGIGSGSHGMQTGRMLGEIEAILSKVVPEWVVVYGDTNSTLAGALAAAKLHIPVAHVEAGLRSRNRRMPEEINRILTDHASDLLLAPTETAVRNLKEEGFRDDRILLVGDVMYDAALFYGAKADQRSQILEDLGVRPKQYILTTIHRAENTDNFERLRSIIEGLELAAREIPVIIPLHPRTREALKQERGLARDRLSGSAIIIEPVGYLDMLMLAKGARLIATDSGGVQKEAFFFHVPCATLRDETEWVELVELGWNHLVPPHSALGVFEGLMDALDMSGTPGHPYGDGNAAQRIAGAINTHRPEYRDH